MDTCKTQGVLMKKYFLRRELRGVFSHSLILFRNAAPKPEHFVMDGGLMK